MIAIEETGIIDAQHRLLVHVPDTVPVGTHRVLVMIEGPAETGGQTVPDPFDSCTFDSCIGAYAGEPAATGRNAEDVLYGTKLAL